MPSSFRVGPRLGGCRVELGGNIRPSEILRVPGRVRRREWTADGALQWQGARMRKRSTVTRAVNIVLLVARSGKSGRGHGFLLKCDPSPLPPLQWLWLAGDGFAA